MCWGRPWQLPYPLVSLWHSQPKPGERTSLHQRCKQPHHLWITTIEHMVVDILAPPAGLWLVAAPASVTARQLHRFKKELKKRKVSLDDYTTSGVDQIARAA